MATSFSIVHDFPCDPAAYWSLFWDESFNQAQDLALRCQRTVSRLEDKDNQIYRVQEVRPQREVPGIMAKLLGGQALAYVESARFAKPLGPLELEVRVPALGDRFSFQGRYDVRTLGPSSCQRQFQGQCRIQIPLLGGRAEQMVVDQTKASYETGAALVREWLAKKPSPC